MLKYHVKNSHEPIIDKDVFASVQSEIQRRAERHAPVKKGAERYPFTGMVLCGICGKFYRRKIAAAGSKYQKPVWICPTFNVFGKDICPSQQIPESILMETAAEAMETANFDAYIFAENITAVKVDDPGFLTFTDRSGCEKQIKWENPSRCNSWTDEMRQTARERQLKILEGRKKK